MKGLTRLADSRKFFAAAISSGLAYLGIKNGMTNEQVLFIVGPLVAFIGAMGLADFGKEKHLGS